MPKLGTQTGHLNSVYALPHRSHLNLFASIQTAPSPRRNLVAILDADGPPLDALAVVSGSITWAVVPDDIGGREQAGPGNVVDAVKDNEDERGR